ncbi:hypothetical protein EON65_56265 [archaeon]|nr:MAG: hypothetical protein EON65_56265 [archaeon]
MYLICMGIPNTHTNLFQMKLQETEYDLSRTSHYLHIFEKMQLLWNQANSILQQARKDMRKAILASAGRLPL